VSVLKKIDGLKLAAGTTAATDLNGVSYATDTLGEPDDITVWATPKTSYAFGNGGGSIPTYYVKGNGLVLAYKHDYGWPLESIKKIASEVGGTVVTP
jgi:hypothetical protein